MAESDSWRNLGSQFRALQPSQGDCLRANWISTAWNDAGEQWYQSGSRDKRLHTVFKWLAERAALQLGHSGGPTAVFFWLDLLRCDSPNFRGSIHGITRDRNGIETHHEGGVIHRLCEASADYCLKLEVEDVTAATRHATRPLEQNGENVTESAPVESAEKMVGRRRREREAVVLPILDKKGWSILEWAIASGGECGVDFHTANDYLKGKTKPRRSTRKGLAESLGIEVADLPS